MTREERQAQLRDLCGLGFVVFFLMIVLLGWYRMITHRITEKQIECIRAERKADKERSEWVEASQKAFERQERY